MHIKPKYKRQRTHYECVGKENYGYYDHSQYVAQVPSYMTYMNSHEMSSPKQELGHVDELFNWLEEENGKPGDYIPSYNPIDEIYNFDTIPDLGFLTPMLPQMNFFWAIFFVSLSYSSVSSFSCSSLIGCLLIRIYLFVSAMRNLLANDRVFFSVSSSYNSWFLLYV